MDPEFHSKIPFFIQKTKQQEIEESASILSNENNFVANISVELSCSGLSMIKDKFFHSVSE